MAASMSHVTGPSKRIYAKCKRFFSHSSGRYNSGEYKTEYDLIVVGGGSGGLACAKEAAFHGRKVAVLDFVNPSGRGASWGLGGTCVNVGCIPKKLMHQAALVGRSIRDAHHYGWDVPGTQPNLSWSTLSSAVQNYVRSLNWGHRVQLNQRNVDYFNTLGTFLDRHTIKATDKQGNEMHLKSKEFVIAIGMRPKYPPEVAGAREHAITSDDLFWMKHSPGKTVIPDVALECAGILTGLGCPTSLLVRSIPLRGFDQQMSGLIVDNMADNGTVIHRQSVPQQVVQEDGQLKVTWKHIPTSVISTETFNTVLMARPDVPAGREAQTKSLGLTDIGVKLDQETGQVIGGHSGESEKSSVDNIYAIGDILHGAPELTPVAVQAGKLLARRLTGMTSEQMDYSTVPTTVFTPLEYGSVGLSEEQALQTLGEDEIEVYHAFYKPLEYAVPGESAAQCYIKVISGRAMPRKVLGLHFLGPNAGEVMQGFALSMRCGLTLCSLQRTVGIHPTCAEEIVKLRITKRSGLDPVVTGC